MFLVGAHISLADFINFIRLQNTLFGWDDVTKVTFPNVFRWADHIQHLPYIWDMVQAAKLVISFPSTDAKPLSKKQLKKLAKAKW